MLRIRSATSATGRTHHVKNVPPPALVADCRCAGCNSGSDGLEPSRCPPGECCRAHGGCAGAAGIVARTRARGGEFPAAPFHRPVAERGRGGRRRVARPPGGGGAGWGAPSGCRRLVV